MMKRTCTAEGCDKPHRARGLCSTCYSRDRASNAPTCTVEGCDRGTKALGLCGVHYDREWRRREGQPRTWQPPRPTVCSAEGCDRPTRSGGLCTLHYGRMRRPLVGRPPGGTWGVLWQDPERRAEIRAAQSDAARRRWADPLKRAALIEAVKAGQAKSRGEPES
jgi:hypothetical protein